MVAKHGFINFWFHSHIWNDVLDDPKLTKYLFNF